MRFLLDTHTFMALLQSEWVNTAIPRHRKTGLRAADRCRFRVAPRESKENHVVALVESDEQQQQLLFSRPCQTARQVFESSLVSFSA